jgi:hypothetical protein
MARYSANFKEWLSGKCNYSEPSSWKCEMRSSQIVIVPTWKPTIILSLVLLGFAGAGVVALFINRHQTAWFFFIVGIVMYGGVTIISFVGLALVIVPALIDFPKGPYFIYNILRKDISLPRENISARFSDAVGWRVVSGNWIGPEGAQQKMDAPLSELHLILRINDDVMAFALTAGNLVSISEPARKIAHSTGLPLEFIEQHQGISHAPPRKYYPWMTGLR